MKRKVILSLILTLLMIVPTFIVGADDPDTCGGIGIMSDTVYPFGDITKEVFDGENWVNSINAEVNDVLRFRITITYIETGAINATCVRDVNVTDTLPACLEYAGDPTHTPSYQSGKTIKWYFGGPYISDGVSCPVETIEFDAKVIAETDVDGEDNFVEVDGLERCSGRRLYGNATATVIVEEPECGYITIEKKVGDGCNWYDSYTAEVGDKVYFNITITYHAIDGIKAKDIVVTDTFTFFDPITINMDLADFNYIPSEYYYPLVWNLTEDYETELVDGESAYIEFAVTVESGSGNFENCAEVEANETCTGCPLYNNSCITVTIEKPPCGEIEIVKKVWDGDSWEDSYTAEIGEKVFFNITVTYFAGCGYVATDIVVKDYLTYPEDMSISYELSDFNYEPSTYTDDFIQWDLTEDHNINLSDIESVYIEFAITTTEGSGIIENCAEVNALEHCCCCDLYDQNCANVTVECVPNIVVEKKVWNGTAWDESVDGLVLDELVKFKIDIYYEACDGYEITNMIVEDILPCCLKYNNTLDISSDAFAIEDPVIETINDNKTVFWKWQDTNAMILKSGQHITIIFDAIMYQYCRGISENIAYAKAWGCQGPEVNWTDEDTAEVDCTPLETKFYKKAKIDDEWKEDEIEVQKGDIITFKLMLEYYGGEDLYDVQFVDILPCILEYVKGSATHSVTHVADEGPSGGIGELLEPEISSDNKTLWWNLSGKIEDGEIVTITFDAEVVGVTADCQECPDVINYAYVTGKIGCVQENNFDRQDQIIIHSGCPDGNCPPSIPLIRGPTSDIPIIGVVGKELKFYFVTVDQDDDQVYYMLNFSDGTTTEWLGPYASGIEKSKTHIYTETGTYKISARAKDTKGHTSGWTPAEYEVIVVIIGQDEPCLEYDPTSYDFGTMQPGQTKSTTFQIWNGNAGTLTYNLTETCSWVELSQTSGDSTGTDDKDTITININTTGLSNGLYTCKILIQSNGGPDQNFTVKVTVDDEEPEAELSITTSMINFGGIYATVKNTGDVDLTDIDWEINVTGGALGRVTLANSDTIDDLPNGDSTTINSGEPVISNGLFKFGLGIISGTIKATAEDCEEEISVSGLIIGKIIILGGFTI